MEFDIENIVLNIDEDVLNEKRERQLTEDEQPVYQDGDDDCGDACKI